MKATAATLAALVALASPAAAAQQDHAAHSPAAAPAEPQRSAGAVSFENSGAAAAQPAFLRGLGLLHNFEYPRAAAAFREAQAADPGFAMAYWGEAMTYNHPIWMEQDAAAARAVLARLGPDRAARIARARTERERAYLEAVEILYGDGGKEERDRAYSAHMAGLAERYPADVDAHAFHAFAARPRPPGPRHPALHARRRSPRAALPREPRPSRRAPLHDPCL